MLRMLDIDKAFAGVRVLSRISLELGHGEILGLVGENGAGKSTLMNILGGVLHRDDRGEMLLEGEPYDPRSAVDADQAGVAFIHQELNLFLNMTVAENLFLNSAPRTRVGLLSYRSMNGQAKAALSRVGIDLHPATEGGEPLHGRCARWWRSRRP